MPTRQLHIEGVVQGVGFRPYVFRLANAYQLKGWVSNDVNGVHVEVSGSPENLAQFESDLFTCPPENAHISRVHRKELPETDYLTFQIIESNPVGEPTVLLTPDLGLCEACRHELTEVGNRRKGYAFITCLNCGPRYSIITGLPYDRPLTTMASFTMCPACQKEFNDPSNRRFYSQTNSCPDCAVALSLVGQSGKTLSTDPEVVLTESIRLLQEGHILAVKGIGGYLLMADATNAPVVQKLRDRKHRPSKPFALLMKSAEAARHYVEINETESQELQSTQSPVVLLRRKNSSSLPGVAPGLDRLGIMLPYTPLLAMLAEGFNGPLIATSGNLSGSPIFYEDHQAFNNLDDIADFFVVNNRSIVVPQDDSVVQFARHGDHRIVLRRSRGMAPLVFQHPFTSAQTTLAMGADLKSAFALMVRGNLYASQYLGDLENFDTQRSYEHTLHHLLGLMNTRPAEVIIDKHPAYFSSHTGIQLASDWQVPVREIQHHQAHFAAVLAENNQLDAPQPILGVIWDGTGLGDDGQVWGGEFFRYENHTFERVAHLDYFTHFLGDKFSREPRLCALALTASNPEAIPLIESKFTDSEWKLYRAMIAKATLKTSSMGRLFDGVASLLGLCDHARYEGEAALFLENCALRETDQMLEPIRDLSTKGIIDYIVHHLHLGSHRSAIAWQFHVALVHWIAQVAREQGCRTLAFSGGVFQNALLNDLLLSMLSEEFELLFHDELSPNDECISYGQLACAQVENKLAAQTHQTETTCASPFPVN